MFSIIRTKKHKTIGSLRKREAHTFRRRETPNADSDKLHRNKLLCGQENYAAGLDLALQAYQAVGNKIRKDGVLAIEYLLTASPEFFDSGPKHERTSRLKEWCDAQVDYLKLVHGEKNILCAYLHLDEKTPHIEAYVVPIDTKGKLNCKQFLGSPAKLSGIQTSYAQHNAKFGLKRGQEGSRATHEEVKKFYTLIKGKTKVTSEDVRKAIKIETPTIAERVNIVDFIDMQQKTIFLRISKLFVGTIYENKLVVQAKKILREWKREADEAKKREYKLESEIERLQLEQTRQTKLVQSMDALIRENKELKVNLGMLWGENQALKARSISPGTPKA